MYRCRVGRCMVEWSKMVLGQVPSTPTSVKITREGKETRIGERSGGQRGQQGKD